MAYLQAVAIISRLAKKGEEIVIDNASVVDYG